MAILPSFVASALKSLRGPPLIERLRANDFAFSNYLGCLLELQENGSPNEWYRYRLQRDGIPVPKELTQDDLDTIVIPATEYNKGEQDFGFVRLYATRIIGNHFIRTNDERCLKILQRIGAEDASPLVYGAAYEYLQGRLPLDNPNISPIATSPRAK